jgi:hypothetical protein
MVPIEDRAPDTAAVMRGPVMLTAIDPPENVAVTRGALNEMEAIPDVPMEFDCRTSSGKIRMRPFYRVQREKYSTYVRVVQA